MTNADGIAASVHRSGNEFGHQNGGQSSGSSQQWR
jgi:hypothetical protein